MITVKITGNVKHDGELRSVGDIIPMTDEQATLLINAKVAEFVGAYPTTEDPATPKAPEMPDTTPSFAKGQKAQAKATAKVEETPVQDVAPQTPATDSQPETQVDTDKVEEQPAGVVAEAAGSTPSDPATQADAGAES